MLKILKKVQTVYDFFTGRYKTFVASDSKDLQACYAIRKQVFQEELNRTNDSACHEPGEVDVYDDKSIHIVCQDVKTKAVVGSARMTPAACFDADEDHIKEYCLDQFPQEICKKVMVVSRLTILKDHRKGGAGLQVACACYEYGVKNGYLLSVSVCEPNLFPMYRFLGYRPLGRVQQSTFGGYRLPIFLMAHDYQHLKNMRSPFWMIAKKMGFEANDEGLKWLREREKRQSTSDPGFSIVSEQEGCSFYAQIMQEISDAGKKQLVQNAVSVECRYGDAVVTEGSGGRNIGFVIQGALQVVKGDEVIAVLGEGDVFGEIAFLLDVPRSADLIAADQNTKIVLMSQSAINKLSSQKDREQFWKNLAKIIAQRLIVKK